MIWIGLTGGIATGKSTAAQLLKSRHHIPVIDADILAKQALEPGEAPYEQTVQHFGPGILSDGKQIDRSKLAQLIFADQKNILKLESFIHPYVQSKVQELKAHYFGLGHKSCIYDVPLLFEKKLQAQFDSVVLIYCPKKIQIERVRVRNPHWSEQEVLQRLGSQMDIEQKRSLADHVVDNSGTLDQLSKKIDQLVQILKL